MATGFVFHELYMWHNTGNFAGPMPFGAPVQPYEHSENPETKRRLRNLLEVSGLLKQLTADRATSRHRRGDPAGAHTRTSRENPVFQ